MWIVKQPLTHREAILKAIELTDSQLNEDISCKEEEALLEQRGKLVAELIEDKEEEPIGENK